MSELSPSAKAVDDAFWKTIYNKWNIYDMRRAQLAAALRAAADQVVPWKPEPTEESVSLTVDFGYAWALFSQANDVRQKLIAIADELENNV